jgi:hypothetical protein
LQECKEQGNKSAENKNKHLEHKWLLDCKMYNKFSMIKDDFYVWYEPYI